MQLSPVSSSKSTNSKSTIRTQLKFKICNLTEHALRSNKKTRLKDCVNHRLLYKASRSKTILLSFLFDNSTINLRDINNTWHEINFSCHLVPSLCRKNMDWGATCWHRQTHVLHHLRLCRFMVSQRRATDWRHLETRYGDERLSSR